jgi:hypothetical protein
LVLRQAHFFSWDCAIFCGRKIQMLVVDKDAHLRRCHPFVRALELDAWKVDLKKVDFQFI